ncbi:MAG: hypothetical protein HQK58_17760, partial [Deltaproteobacteria bacterium]|nr:hypothetical protein [Deltaproteobacteria bacterium]
TKRGLKEGLDVVYRHEIGYAEKEAGNKNIALADAFAAWPANLIVTIGSSTSLPVIKKYKGKAIPLLFIGVTDPVGDGMVLAVGKPSQVNVTGVTFPIPVAQTMAVVNRVFPKVKAFCFVHNSHLPPDASYARWMREYAEHSSPPVRFLDTDRTKGIPEEAMSAAEVFLGYYSLHLYRWAQKYPKIPFVGNSVEDCRWGAVISIYPKLPEMGGQAAEMAHKILQGRQSPGDIPSESAQHYAICLNLNRAKELGIRIPVGVQDLADETIE